jgi:hypothetical protein
MERQGYVLRKAERQGAGQDGDEVITWHVGPRAKEEIGLDGVIGMAKEVYGEWNEDLEKKIRASLGIRATQQRSAQDADTSRVVPDDQDE